MINVNDFNPQLMHDLIEKVDRLEKMLYNYDAKGIIKGVIKGIKIIQVTETTGVEEAKILSEMYKNENGGIYRISDIDGNLNVKIGSENGNGANNGGVLILYNDGEDKPRVEIGISDANGSGEINLKDTNGKVRAILYADGNLGPVMAIRDSSNNARAYVSTSGMYVLDSSGNVQSYLEGTIGRINNQTIATQTWVNNAISNAIDNHVSAYHSE